MKKKIILLLLIVLGFESRAQVGINTTTPKAQLEIKSTNEATPANTDGLLIPKINAFPVTNPTVDQQGMLVYLTTAIGANTPGFYFWNNPTVTWLPIGNNNNSDWKLTGNSGTNPATNFIGTTDNQDVVFRRFNFRSGLLGITNTSFGFNALNSGVSGGFNTAFGVGALDVCSTGYENTAVGYDALGANTTGFYNTAFGRASLLVNTDGFDNSAYGYQSLRNNLTGNYNAAFGRQALLNNSTGESNVAIGKESLKANTTGSFNTAIGYQAFLTGNALENATAIGSRSQVDSSNSLVLGSIAGVNGATSSVNVGIGIASPLERLHVSGRSLFTNGFSVDNAALLYPNNTNYMFIGPQSGSGANGANMALFGSTNVSSGNAGGIDFSSPSGKLRINHNNGSFVFGANSSSNYTTTLEMNDVGLQLGHNSNSRAIVLNTANTEKMRLSADGNLGIGTSSPKGLLDIDSSSKGILIPRVSLTSSIVSSPVTNPSGGALAESTLIYNTATAGVAPNDVSPGYYYWTGLKWNKFDVDEKNKHYTAVGTTNVVTSTSVQLMPQMEITFTPKSSVVFVDFSASGLASNKGICVSFDLMLNGSLVKRFQTASDQIENPVTPYFANGCLWDMVFNYPIALIPDTENTISINWVSTGPGASINNNATATPTIIGALGYSAQGHRVLKVLDPQGGGGVVTSTPVPTANDFWKINGNSGTVAGTNYLGTNDNQSLAFKTNNTEQVRLLANGNFGIGVPNPVERLQVAGKSLFTNGFSADNAALVYRNDTDYMFLGPQSGSSADGGALALYGSTNVSGGNAGGVDLNVPGSQVRMNHTNGSYTFRANSTSGYNATFELNDVGLQIGHNSGGRAVVFNTASTERMRLTGAGRVGIGVTIPGGQLELSLNEGRKPGSNAWTIVSDQRLKNVNGIFTKGLNEIIQLNPIRYNYKNNGERKFEQEVLNTEFAGFLAQEVQQIFPEAVGTDADGYLNFDLHPILVAYTNAFKELDLKNQAVEDKNRELELKLKSQEQIINNLIERLEKLEAKN